MTDMLVEHRPGLLGPFLQTHEGKIVWKWSQHTEKQGREESQIPGMEHHLTTWIQQGLKSAVAQDFSVTWASKFLLLLKPVLTEFH